MKLKRNERLLILFDNKFSEIKCIDNNQFIVKNIKDNTIEIYNKMQILSKKITSVPLHVSCPEDFGFILLNPQEIKDLFTNKKDLFPYPSLYFKDKNDVIIVQTGNTFKVLYQDFISEDFQYIDELEKLYFQLIGKEVQFNPDKTPYSWKTE